MDKVSKVLGHLCKGMKQHCKNLKRLMKLTNLDKINILQNELIILLCLGFNVLYSNSFFYSIRNIISDTIALSSIILGILGVLIGILIGFKEDSDFFKKANAFGKHKFFFSSLIKKIRNAFLVNMIFVVITIGFNLILPSSLLLIKSIVIAAWLFLLMKILWQVSYLIIIITKIADYKLPDENVRRKKS